MKVKLNERIGEIKGHLKCTLLDLEGNVLEVKEYDNLVTTAFKNSLAALLNAEAPNNGIINYGAVGTSTATPAITDTQLGAEVGRVVVYSRSRAANVTTLQFYFGPTEANGALKEFGAFIAGTASADTGLLFDRAAIDVTKTSLNSLIIQLTITVT